MGDVIDREPLQPAQPDDQAFHLRERCDAFVQVHHPIMNRFS
jgi:hypothetical protein